MRSTTFFSTATRKKKVIAYTTVSDSIKSFVLLHLLKYDLTVTYNLAYNLFHPRDCRHSEARRRTKNFYERGNHLRIQRNVL